MKGAIEVIGRAGGLALAVFMTAPSAQETAAAETAPQTTGTVPVADEAPSEAPAPEATELDVITVTSSKRIKAQRDIPGSIGVLRGDDLEKIKAQGLADYVKLVPGVVLLDRGVDGGIPVIRGITTSAGALGTHFTQLPVGIYVDDMPFTDLYVPFSQPDLNPFDLERVEILKGPQGTLFGSGALSGGIRYILQKPKPSVWEGKLSATTTSSRHGGGQSPVYAGALNAPLGDSAALRIVGVVREDSGLIDEVGTDRAGNPYRHEDVNTLDQFTGRILGNWAVTERLSLEGFYFHQNSEQHNTPNADNPRRFERDTSHAAGNETFRESGFGGGNVVARYAFDWGDFLSSSNYLVKDVVNDSTGPAAGLADPNGDPDGDGGANGPGAEDAGQRGAIAYLNSQTEGWFQEFRLASPEGGEYQPFDWMRVEWLVGVSYQRSDQAWQQFTAVEAVEQAFVPIEMLPILPIGTPLGSIEGSREASVLTAALDGVATEQSLFGEATARLGEHWEATLGGRLFRTKLVATGFLAGAQIVALNAGSTEVEVDRLVKEDGFNPKVSLRYLFNDQVQVYALAAKGFQFGGIQLNPPLAAFTATAPDAFVPYLSSQLWNYELGLRTEFFDRRLKWDTTLFHLDWQDLQITIRRALVPMGENFGLTVGFTENIGRAKSEGVESSLSVAPLPGLTLTTSASWIKAVTTEGFASSQGFVPEGTRLPGSPKFQMANVLSYTRPFTLLGAWEGGATLTHTHIGESWNTLQYINGATWARRQGGYDTLDVNLNLLKPDWRSTPQLTLSMLNISDVRGVAAVSSTAGGRNVDYFFTRPRTAIASLTLRF